MCLLGQKGLSMGLDLSLLKNAMLHVLVADF